jgi:hypothetical protein
MSPVPRSNDPRNYPRPGAVGGDRASAMARPALATAVPGTNQRSQVVATGATSGTFTLHVQGRSGDLDLTTAAINWNDSQAALPAKNGRGFRGSSPSAMAHPKPLGQGRR